MACHEYSMLGGTEQKHYRQTTRVEYYYCRGVLHTRRTTKYVFARVLSAEERYNFIFVFWVLTRVLLAKENGCHAQTSRQYR